MTVRFRSEAARDVAGAREWYDARSPALGDAFVGALEQVVELISELPEAFPEIAGGTRRALLSRFPYVLYYHLDGDGIEVVACLHTRQAPTRWRSRE